MSHYRVLSIDQATGAIKNQMEFTERWGDMPYVYGTHDGKIVFVGPGPIKVLNPDLTPTGIELNYKGRIESISPDGTTLAWQTLPGTTFLSADTLKPIENLTQSEALSINRNSILTTNESWTNLYPKDSEFETLVDPSGDHLIFHGNCGSNATFLTNNHILLDGCGAIRIIDTEGKTVIASKSIGPLGTFAGVSQNGSRFALEYSDERGDPEFLLYEQFIIYDAATAKPLITVPIHDLPERQSWSAFSPDGHYFAVGSPDKLTLYRIP